VHRDVKGDNFMMDLPEVENPANRIYLSDFGTVVELKEGERRKDKVGTKNYWSPEFYRMNYSLKVDCWAVGVIMFGFFSGKFPFKTEEEVKHKKLAIHTRVGEEGEKLIRWAFERDEKKRCNASEAAQHPFLVGAVSDSVVAQKSEREFKPDFKDTGGNAYLADRRRELVDRLLKNATQAAEANATGKVKATSSHAQRSNSLIVLTKSDYSYSVTDKHTGREITFTWTAVEEAKPIMDDALRSTPVSTAVVNQDVSKQSVKRLLKHHDISLDNFGKGKAKPLDAFVEEVQQGKTRLLIDATRPKCLVRVVDVVLLRIFVKTSQGRKYLVEYKEQFPDGRVQNNFRLPGHMKAPHENVMQTAERLVRENLNMKDCKIVFEFSHVDRVEQAADSTSYPGVHTVYVKETVTGVMTINDPQILKRVGMNEKGTQKFDVKDSQKYVRGFQWMSEQECVGKGISLRPRPQEEEISALVNPPVGMDEDQLKDYLTDLPSVDLSLWGDGTAKSVADFSDELIKGESTLHKQDNGRVVRLVDIVVLKIIKVEVDKDYVLREVEETVGDKTQTLDRLPAMKRRADEHPFIAAKRLVSRNLHIDEVEVNLDPDDVRIVETEQKSMSYPGLVSVYRKRFISATMRALPEARRR